MEPMIIKVTEKSRGLLITNEDGTREVVVSVSILSKATEELNQKLMNDIMEVYKNYRESVKWWG